MCAQAAQVRTNGDGLQLASEFYTSGINRYCHLLVKAVAPVCIILHGSVARGTFTPRSDVDVLVIGGDLPPHFLERIQVLMQLNDTHAPIEPLGYTTDEFADMLKNRHVTALDALYFGVPLYGSTYFRGLRRIFDQMVMQGLRRTKCTWTMSES